MVNNQRHGTAKFQYHYDFRLTYWGVEKNCIPEPAVVENQKSYLLWINKNDKLTVSHFMDWIKQINFLFAQSQL